MIDLETVKNFYLYTNKVDMRFGIPAIQKRLALSFSPIQILDSLFIFVSRDKKSVKIYYENEHGCWLFINKLKYYKIQIENSIEKMEISEKDLKYLLKGVEMESQISKKIYI